MTATLPKYGEPMTSLTVPAVRTEQDGTVIYLTFFRGGDLETFTEVDRYDPALPLDHPDQGYQRREEPPRVKKLGNWLRTTFNEGDGILMPTGLLLNNRGGGIQFDEATGQLTIISSHRLQVVDGQHRRAGLIYAIKEKGIEELRDFMVPVIIVEGMDRLNEMKQFALVNGTQKSVRTDLVNMILTRLSAAQGDAAIRESDQWKVVVTRVVEALNAEPGPWRGLVAMPNEVSFGKAERLTDPRREHQKIVRATSFMTSLKPLYDFFEATEWDVSGASTKERAERMHGIVRAFWGAVADLNAEAIRSPNNHVLQKTPGLFALHRLCKRLLPIIIQARRDPTSVADWIIMLDPCTEIGDAGYWEKSGGTAAAYGSMKGFAELSDLLWESLKA